MINIPTQMRIYVSPSQHTIHHTQHTYIYYETMSSLDYAFKYFDSIVRDRPSDICDDVVRQHNASCCAYALCVSRFLGAAVAVADQWE